MAPADPPSRPTDTVPCGRAVASPVPVGTGQASCPAPTQVAPPAERGAWRSILLFCVSVATSAFLLFQVQPVIGKCILPWFGSSPGVLATCMLFFQLLLLVGYAYAHFIVSRLASRRQALVHGSLLLLALLALPIAPDPSWKPVDAAAPAGRILLVLAASVGLPYLLLSATGPLLQGWFARLHPGRSPYRLYALSNAGSLLALLSYPFLIEPVLRLTDQTTVWSLGYALFAVLGCACAWVFMRGAPALPQAAAIAGAPPTARPRFRQIAMWLSLSACGSGLLLATTNQMCLDVAVVPFLWIVPLCLYLLSFILCFDSDRWYIRPLFFALLPIVIINVVRLLYGGVHLGLVDQIGGYSLALFVCCMCSHGELARLRPAPRHLTLFYLILSIGGAAGGLFVAIVAPSIFTGFYEYHILLAVCAAFMAGIALRAPSGAARGSWRPFLSALCSLIGLGALVYGSLLAMASSSWLDSTSSTKTLALFQTWKGQMGTVLLVLGGLLLVHAELQRRTGEHGLIPWWGSRRRLRVFFVRGTLVLGVAVLAGSLVWIVREDERRHVHRDRNFYGMLAIREYSAGHTEHAWELKHGRIRHGEQLKQQPDWPTSYYGPRSGIGLALRLHPRRLQDSGPFRVGVIGLGTGTMAAYANAHVDPRATTSRYVQVRRPLHPDVMRFYEINPMVSTWAEEKFTFLRDARARGADVRTLLGDARIVLERQLVQSEAQAFDVLAVDAFSSDAIPIHLLTKEALVTYWRHLREDGILALHVSNRFLDLKPVVRRLAEDLGHDVLYIKNKDRDSRHVDSASWMLMTSNDVFLRQEAVHHDERDVPPPGPLWTDDFSSLFELIKKE